MMQWFAFKVADEVLGIDVQHVYRVVDDAQITPVPLLPICYLGLIYFQGEVFEVIDIVNLLGHGEANLKGDSRIILVKWAHKKLALVTDKIVGLLWIENDNSEKTVFKNKHTMRHITPEYIWNTLLKLPYGHQKIPNYLHSGVGEIPKGIG